MRGRNEIRLSCHVSAVAAPLVLLAGRNSSALSTTTTSKSCISASRQQKSQSVSLLCWKNSWTTLVDVTFGERPFSPAILRTMSLAETCWNVRVLRWRLSLCDLS